MEPALAHPLDAPTWGSLTTTHHELSSGDGSARRLARDVGLFGAYDPASDGSGLTGMLGDRDVVLLVGQSVPPGCFRFGGGDAYQMVLEAVPDDPVGVDWELLGPADADAMHALVALTEPGPWAPRTAALGTYLGVRRGGELVAMAGERLRPPGFTEISAVCTHPSARREGLARALCAELARRIVARDETPFLHVHVDNSGALPVYEKLGFTIRRTISFTAIRRGD